MANVFGIYHPPLEILKEFVTLDTEQTITASKEFTEDVYFESIYPTEVHFPDGSIQTTANTLATTEILVTNTATSTVCYPCFVDNNTTGSQDLYMCDPSTLFTYRPSSGFLTSFGYNVGVATGTTFSRMETVNSGTHFQFTNYAWGGNILFQSYTALGNAQTALQWNTEQLQINTTNPPTCSAVQPLATDSSNKIPTTAWVQSAILATGQNLLPQNNTWTGVNTFNLITYTHAIDNNNTYINNAGMVRASAITTGSQVPNNPANSTMRQQSGTFSEIINNATNGQFNFYLHDNSNNQVQVLNMNATGSTFQKQLILGGTGADSQITCVFHALKDNTLNTNQGLIYCDNGWFLYDNNAHGGRHRFTNNTSGGVQTVPLDFGSTFMTIDITNPPTCTAPQPASTDSSNKIPTTAWVQSAITVAGVNSANTVVMTNNASTNASYPVCFASGSPDGAKSVYQDYTTFAYNPSTNNLSLSSINDIPISLEAGSSIKIGLVGYTDANPLDQNTCIGMYAGGRTARGNTLLGFSAGYNVRFGGDDNVIIGRSAGANVSSGFRNVLIGRDSGNQLATGQRNIAIGFQTGFNSSTASDNILIGSSLLVSATFNNIIIGSTIAGSVADSVYIGTNTQTQYVQTQLNYRTLNYTNTSTNTQNYLYTLPNNLPQIVFLKSLAPFGTFYLYLPDPANGFNYNGTTITFRWAFQTGYYRNNWTVFINGGASKIVVRFLAPAASVALNSYVGATFLCDDVYWYLQETIAAQ